MKIVVAVTNNDWFEFLRKRKAQEVNFWQPGNKRNKFEEGDLFLFKLPRPRDCIAGGGFVVKSLFLPIPMVWDFYEESNGSPSFEEFYKSIKRMRKKLKSETTLITEIPCVLLTDVFYFSDDDAIPTPESFSKYTLNYKYYYPEERDGLELYNSVMTEIRANTNTESMIMEDENRYAISPTKHRLGQGAFRALVTDAYRKCAITGEKTLPVLEAAHIKPYSDNGPHLVSNGILLRSDLHKLFDKGYITVNTDYRIEVSDKLHEDYGNGKDYYKYRGSSLILPDDQQNMPSRDFLSYHKEKIFIG